MYLETNTFLADTSHKFFSKITRYNQIDEDMDTVKKTYYID